MLILLALKVSKTTGDVFWQILNVIHIDLKWKIGLSMLRHTSYIVLQKHVKGAYLLDLNLIC